MVPLSPIRNHTTHMLYLEVRQHSTQVEKSLHNNSAQERRQR